MIINYRKLITFIVACLAPVPAMAGLKVAVSIPPLEMLVREVMDGVEKPSLVLRPRQEVHGMHLSPSQAATIREADVFFVVDSELEGAVATLAPSRTVALGRARGVTLLPVRSRDDGHETHDLHMWADPVNAIAMADAIAAALAERDQPNAARYSANAKALKADLQNADARFASEAPHLGENSTYLVVHDAGQYLERRYRLPAPLLLATDHHAGASVASMERVLSVLKEKKLSCILAEAGNVPKMAETLARRTKAPIIELDVEGKNTSTGMRFVTFLDALRKSYYDCFQGT